MNRFDLALMLGAAVATVVGPTAAVAEPAAGETAAIVARAKLWRQRHGDPDAPTRLARAGFAARQRRAAAAKDDEPGWVSLGPTDGAGRCTSVAPHPTRLGTVLVGAAGGGVWRTIDDGASWQPLTDELPDLAVGALVIAPSEPDVVYLGTGEGGLAFDFIPGIGLLRSDDGGSSWLLPDSVVADQFFSLSVDPRAAARLLAGTERGVLTSDDGGYSWQVTLADPALVGVTELVRSSSRPDLVWASVWCFGSCPDGIDRVMRSTDNGVSWLPAAVGLPAASFNDPALNRTGLAIAPSDDSVLYAGVEVNGGGDGSSFVYRSSDGGSSWQDTGYHGDYLSFQSWYDNSITVAPDDPQTVIAAGVWYVTSRDGGATWTTLNPYDDGNGAGTDSIPHVDAHDLQWQHDRLWLANDGGIWISDDRAASWAARSSGLVTRQFYSIALDGGGRDRLLGGTQDNGTNLRRDPARGWDMVIPFDGFDCALNPVISDFMYATLFTTYVYRTLVGPDVIWDDISPPLGNDPAPFATPLTMRPEPPWELYTGSTRVWRSRDGGSSWVDLATDVTNGSWSTDVVWAVAVTAADPERVLVAKGSAVYASGDGGETWRVTAAAARVNHVELSPFDADLGWAAVARNGTTDGQLLRTTDGGASWQPSGSGLPPYAVQVVRADPVDPLTVYAGSDLGLFRSTDGGASWTSYGVGLPAASVHDIRLSPDGARLVIATHGRGVWELATPPSANHPPTISIETVPAPIEVPIGVPLELVASAADPDSDPLEVGWLFTDDWSTAAGGGGVGAHRSEISHTYRRAGSSFAAVWATDGAGGVASDTLAVTAVEPGDACATPRVVPAAGPFPWLLLTENQSASIGSTDPLVPCASDPEDVDAGRWGSIWFELTPALSGRYAIATCGSTADTVLSAWTGPACGPYSPLPDACNDDDGYVHCSNQRTDSYLELDLTAGETTRFMVGSWRENKRGNVRLTVSCLSCEPPVADRRWVVPAVAHLPGLAGTTWRTDLALFNPAAAAVTATIELLGEAGDGAPVPTAQLALGPRTQVEAGDVVAGLLGSGGAGAIHVAAEHDLLVTSRTFNDATAGSFGQGIPAVAVAHAVAVGGGARLVGLREGAGFRTNIGLANVDEVAAAVVLELRAPNGRVMESRELALPARARIQLDRPFADLGGIDNGYAQVRNVGTVGRVVAYASVVDDGTGDPTYVTAGDLAGPDAPVWVPAAARTAGYGGTLWRTDLTLVNVSDLDLLVTVSFVPEAALAPPPSQVFRITRRVSFRIEDVVERLLGGDGAGAIRVEVDRGFIAASSRTFTAAPGGTYGQHLPGLSAFAAATVDQPAVLAQLHQDATFRTNVGFVSIAGGDATVQLAAHAGDGARLAERAVVVRAGRWLQLNRPLPRGTAYATVTVDQPGVEVLAYASVIDNASNDPTFIPPWH